MITRILKRIICIFRKHKWELRARIYSSMPDVEYLSCSRCFAEENDLKKIIEWQYYRKMEGINKVETREVKEYP